MIDRFSPAPSITPHDRRHNYEHKRAALRSFLEARGFAVYALPLTIDGKRTYLRVVLPAARIGGAA